MIISRLSQTKKNPSHNKKIQGSDIKEMKIRESPDDQEEMMVINRDRVEDLYQEDSLGYERSIES